MCFFTVCGSYGFQNSSFWDKFGGFALWSLFSLQPRWGTVGFVGQGCCLGDWVTGCNLSMGFSMGCIAAKLGVVMEFLNRFTNFYLVFSTVD